MEWRVRITEDNLRLVAEGKTLEKILRAGVLRVTQDPEGGLALAFTPEVRG